MRIVTDPQLRGDKLWSALNHAIQAVSEDNEILITKTPEWSEGLNILEINDLAAAANIGVTPVFETVAIVQGGMVTDRSIKIHHPDIDDPLEVFVWRKYGSPKVTDGQIARLLAYLEAWQQKREAQIKAASVHPSVEQVNTSDSPGAPKRFHIALSFPSEDRGFVLSVANALASTVTRNRVFYDEWYEPELLGTAGDLKLQSMYKQSDLVVPFFSKHYDKPWCAMEWETIRSILLNRRRDDSVIPVHLDDTQIQGWSDVNFGIRVRKRTPQQIAEVLLQSLYHRFPLMKERALQLKSDASSAAAEILSAASRIARTISVGLDGVLGEDQRHVSNLITEIISAQEERRDLPEVEVDLALFDSVQLALSVTAQNMPNLKILQLRRQMRELQILKECIARGIRVLALAGTKVVFDPDQIASCASDMIERLCSNCGYSDGDAETSAATIDVFLGEGTEFSVKISLTNDELREVLCNLGPADPALSNLQVPHSCAELPGDLRLFKAFPAMVAEVVWKGACKGDDVQAAELCNYDKWRFGLA